MTHLTNDPYAVRQETGFDPFAHSLPPKLAVDGFRSTMPLMALADGMPPTIFLKEIDRTNVEELERQDVRFVWFAPYFSFGGLRPPSDAYPDLVIALDAELKDVTSVDPSMSIDLLAQLGDEIAARVQLPSECQLPRNRYVVDRAQASKAFGPGRRELKESSEGIISDLDDPRVQNWLEREPEDRFTVLDRLMEEAQLDAVLVASPLAVQDLTGIPMRAIDDEVWAICPREGKYVHVLSHRELPWPGLPRSGPMPSVMELAGGSRIGIEEVGLTAQALHAFDLVEVGYEPATSLLRRWRELRAWEDVAAYAVGSRLTLDAIADALSYVEACFADGTQVTEAEAYERYRAAVGSFIRDRKLPIYVRTYFTHTHAGDRSHFPASATDHPIPMDSSLKIDGGLEIYDSRGLFIGVSDITRSAVGSSEAREFYELLGKALLEGAIDACRSGAKGSDVFAAGLSFLEPYRHDIVEAGFMPASDAPLADLFRRNIGHLIGKQEPSTVEFTSSDGGSITAGMIAAAEFQWPFANYCIGVEDIFLVTDDEPVNLTRPT
jgi:Xaa-Pro aminopeptidase